MTNTNLGDELKLERKLGESLELRCESHAIPKATVTWYKDDIELVNITSQDTGHLVIPYMRPEDQGHYRCVVANRLGEIEQTVNVKITSKSQRKSSDLPNCIILSPNLKKTFTKFHILINLWKLFYE